MDKSQYFYRTVVFTRLKDNQVALADIHNPGETTTLESWLGTVVALADGQHSIQELTEYLASRYQGGPPSDLEKTIESVLERLSEGKIIQMSEKTVTLPYYLAAPLEELDTDKAKQLMHEDGYTQH